MNNKRKILDNWTLYFFILGIRSLIFLIPLAILSGLVWVQFNCYKEISIKFQINSQFDKVALYLILLFSIILFQVVGKWILTAFNRVALEPSPEDPIVIHYEDLKKISEELACTMMDIFNIRKQIYKLLIIAYFVTSVEKLSNTRLIHGEIWTIGSSVLLEVLVICIAIDTYSNMFSDNRNEKEVSNTNGLFDFIFSIRFKDVFKS